MKLLLRKNIAKLGIIGDIVEVAEGYARNYLLPQGLATQPTEANIRALAEARKIAEREQAERRAALAAEAERLEGIEVTIHARANEEGVLYGSVGRREIAAALNAEGHDITEEQVALREPIRRLDNVAVEVRLLEDVQAMVKVWVVRERVRAEEEEEEASQEEADQVGAGMEAGADGEGTTES
jgi:large subunit ribosomal protein L9